MVNPISGIRYMRIGELAAESGLSRDTLRFYEARGLIRAVRSGNGYRHYPAETVQTLFYIRTAQRLGFSLTEIGENLDRVADAPDPDQMVEALLLEKLATIDERVSDLQALRQMISERIGLPCPLRGKADTPA